MYLQEIDNQRLKYKFPANTLARTECDEHKKSEWFNFKVGWTDCTGYPHKNANPLHPNV